MSPVVLLPRALLSLLEYFADKPDRKVSISTDTLSDEDDTESFLQKALTHDTEPTVQMASISAACAGCYAVHSVNLCDIPTIIRSQMSAEPFCAHVQDDIFNALEQHHTVFTIKMTISGDFPTYVLCLMKPYQITSMACGTIKAGIRNPTLENAMACASMGIQTDQSLSHPRCPTNVHITTRPGRLFIRIWHDLGDANTTRLPMLRSCSGLSACLYRCS